MAKGKETVDNEPLGITDAIMELWNRASNPNLTTSQEIEAIDPILAKKYREKQEVREAVLEIRAMLKDGKSKKRGLWNAFCHAFGVFKSEGDKLFKE